MTTYDLSYASLEKRGLDPREVAGVLPYASPKVTSVQGNFQDRLIVELDGRREDLDALLDQIGDALGRKRPPRAPKTLHRHLAAPHRPSAPWAELLASGAVREMGLGRVAYSGLFLEIVEAIDGLLARHARSVRASEMYLPQFVSTADLERGGYFDHFPQLLVFAAPLQRNLSTIEAFRASREPRGDLLSSAGGALKTSACAPLYPALRGSIFDSNRRVTVLGHCTRHEGAAVDGLRRLSEFRMREIVFFGDDAGAAEFKDESLALLRGLIEGLDLESRLMTANDPFFVTHREELCLAQSLGEDKIEARAAAGDEEIAIASFNRHHEFFGRRFEIFFGSEPAVSCCIGVGLERLAYATFCRYGLDAPAIHQALARTSTLLHLGPR